MGDQFLCADPEEHILPIFNIFVAFLRIKIKKR